MNCGIHGCFFVLYVAMNFSVLVQNFQNISGTGGERVKGNCNRTVEKLVGALVPNPTRECVYFSLAPLRVLRRPIVLFLLFFKFLFRQFAIEPIASSSKAPHPTVVRDNYENRSSIFFLVFPYLVLLVVTLTLKNLVLWNPSCVKSPCFFFSLFGSCAWFSERMNGSPPVWSSRSLTWCLLWLGFIFPFCVFWLTFWRYHTTRLGS
jgi:hypothetical protein